MARTADQVHVELMQETLRGWVIPRRDAAPDVNRDTLFAALLRPLAEGLARLEAQAESMMAETDPRTAVLCLPDFERVLGPDPCGRDVSAYALADRQRLAFQRWTARGGASIPYFVAFAAARGVAITIEENRTSQAEAAECDFEIIEDGEQFVWTATLAALGETLFEAEGGASDDSLYDLTISDIECDIRRLAPAHTVVVFRYV